MTIASALNLARLAAAVAKCRMDTYTSHLCPLDAFGRMQILAGRLHRGMAKLEQQHSGPNDFEVWIGGDDECDLIGPNNETMTRAAFDERYPQAVEIGGPVEGSHDKIIDRQLGALAKVASLAKLGMCVEWLGAILLRQSLHCDVRKPDRRCLVVERWLSNEHPYSCH